MPMPFPGSFGGLLFRRRQRRRTVRLRLTLLYGGLFLASSVCLLGITYLLVAARFPGKYATGGPGTHTHGTGTHAYGTAGAGTSPLPPSALSRQVQQSVPDLHQFVLEAGMALAIMSVAAIGLGWLMAGRILRPLRTMTVATRQIFEDNLHRRLAVQGPPDELKELGDTIDGLLARLEAAFEAQRRFVANASHELRTPLTLERAILDVALADPAATAETLRTTCEEVLATGRQQERLINALLTLASSQRGLDHREPFDLDAVAGDVLRARRQDIENGRVRVHATLGSARGSGDPRLIERLVANLVDNALRYNVAGGGIEVLTATRAGRAVVSVVNTGPVVPADQIERLLQPFQRLTADRTGEREGLGLGLSIVAAIVKAHDGDLAARPGPGGGLEIEVSFTAAPVRDPASVEDPALAIPR
jgi:signal transduction histidine kinase